MRILVSNDDGISAIGIEVLHEACSRVGDVTVVAPDREQSASSHSLSLFRPLRPIKRREGQWEVDGTPTDCVVLALEKLLDAVPNLVFSGVNHGPNMGEDVLYSGTVAVAMEALLAGIPGIAISFAGRQIEYLETQRDWVRRLVREIAGMDDFPTETLLNINLPPVPAAEIRGIRVTKLGRRVYSDSFKHTKGPDGQDIYQLGGGKSSWTGGEDSDFRAVAERYISVTPLHVDLTHYDHLDLVRSWNLGG